MKNKDKSRTIVKIGVHKHLQGLTLKEIEVIQEEYFKENNLAIFRLIINFSTLMFRTL